MKRRQEAAEEAERQRLQAEAGKTSHIVNKLWIRSSKKFFLLVKINERRKNQQSDRPKNPLAIKLTLELPHEKKPVSFHSAIGIFLTFPSWWKWAFPSIKKSFPQNFHFSYTLRKNKINKNQNNLVELVINVQSLCEPPHQLKKNDLCLSQVINKQATAEQLFLSSFLFHIFFILTFVFDSRVFGPAYRFINESLRLKICFNLFDIWCWSWCRLIHITKVFCTIKFKT